jgi:hypothetical protein
VSDTAPLCVDPSDADTVEIREKLEVRRDGEAEKPREYRTVDSDKAAAADTDVKNSAQS